MAITKRDLAQKIKRRFGHPMVKVELDNSQIFDAIDLARDKHIKWAVGNSVTETFFTVMLSGGQQLYDLPVGITEVIAYDDKSGSASGGINTLFTVDNYLYNQGLYQSLFQSGGDGYTIVSYHIARDFLDTVHRYTPTKYSYKYHRYSNQLEVWPAPDTGNSLTIGTTTYDSPGFILLRAFAVEGSQIDSTWVAGGSDSNFYTSDWIFDYATAECKIILGMIRRKFANFQAMGNQSISLDGDQLISEGKEEKQYLEETLRLEEAYEGYGIEIGW